MTQNVHNSQIQTSVKDSINRLTTRTDLDKYDKQVLLLIIQTNNNLTESSKSLLIEYSKNKNVHSLLLLTFSEVLWYVLQTINTDFNETEQKEIYKVLNQEIKDGEGLCFTGRLNRIVNCLNGFSPLVNIYIKDNEQIGNIIFLIKDKLEKENSYTIKKHKELVIKELEERKYDNDVIKIWLEHIE